MAGATVSIPMLPLVRNHIIVESIVIALTTAVLGFRILARMQALGLGADDYLVITGYVIMIAYVGIIMSCYDFLPTMKEYPLLQHNLPKILKDLFAASPIYISCITCLKASVLLFYRRIFNSTGWVRLATWAMLAMLLVCIPIRKNWDTGLPGACYNAVEMYKALCVTNILTDLIIMALPVKVILSLQMRKVEKAVLISCFALGLSVCAISAVRLSALYDLDMQANLTGTIELTVFLAVLELCPGAPPENGDGSNSHGLVTFGRSDPRKRYYQKRQKQDDDTIVSPWEMNKYQGGQQDSEFGDDTGSERRLAPVRWGPSPTQ
ncbi:hypothetical protein PG996_008693 [Apiospora saccharicola]|uniref:Rhodopsin domain-containing protein n=1 Tax=Apiospora saccharicola TaxID=335842 RepID=A0ABR1V166_9PEZI